jgi:D-glycero-beta-D-manno-heptose-7-phosphate kinase
MNILVIGESCKDVFIYGDATRLNPEAPTPILVPKYRTENMGMAANVVTNLKSLGFSNLGWIHQNEPIVKTRYVDDKSNYIMLRVDEENNVSSLKISDYDFSEYDAIIISDYNKGFLSKDIIKHICSSNKNTFIDTKKDLGDWVLDAKFIKLNNSEYKNPLHENGILEKLKHKIIVTLGSDGAKWNGNNFKTNKVKVLDVSGAGDTFMAAFVFKYLQNDNVSNSIEFANKCAAHVVSLRGVNDLSTYTK